MKPHAVQTILRGILLIIGFGFLVVGMSFIWGLATPWFTSFFIGSAFISFSVALLWIGIFQSYRAFVPIGIGALISFGGMGIYLLRIENYYGEYCLYVALLFLWLFFLGLKWRQRKTDYLPFSVQCLFGLILTLALIEGLYLVIPISSYFVWVLTHEFSVLYGWILIGCAIIFAGALAVPTWEIGYPLLYGLLIFDLLIIGPFLTLFTDQNEIVVMPFFLWASLILIIGSAVWALIELAKRLFTVKNMNVPQ